MGSRPVDPKETTVSLGGESMLMRDRTIGSFIKNGTRSSEGIRLLVETLGEGWDPGGQEFAVGGPSE